MRSLESWAQVEELNQHANSSFAERMERQRDSKLDPVLSRQLETIHQYKSYLTSSLSDLEQILGEKRKSAKKKQAKGVEIGQILMEHNYESSSLEYIRQLS